MIGLRKFLVYILSVVLFLSLLATAFSTSAYLALHNPNKLESWLSQSNIYSHFVSNAVAQAKKSAGSSENQGSVTLSDAAVQQAAQSAFSNQLIQQSVNTFLDSNYAWLEGKATHPSFAIDLTEPKQSFAQQVGQYVKDHIASLPICTPQQLAAIGDIQSVDPLNITCRPANLDPQAEATLVTQKVEGSNFLSNPVVTANNISPNGGSSAQPYYQRFSKAPAVFKWVVKMPWLYAAVSAVSGLLILFGALRKRLGLRRIGVILIVDGLVLIVVKLLLDVVVKHLEKLTFNVNGVGQLQQSLSSFGHRAESQLVKVDLWFGIAYLIMALIIFLILRFTRHRLRPVPSEASSDSIATRLRNDQSQPARPPQPDSVPPPKRPRLIQ